MNEIKTGTRVRNELGQVGVVIESWHFLPAPAADDVYRTRYTNEIVCVGGTLRVEGPIKFCERGLHASRRIIDALSYAPGPIVCHVRMSGTIVEGDDKLVASERTVIAMADVSTLLNEFACDCAERVLIREREIGREPDERLWAAIAAKRKWLRGEMSDDELDAANAAAYAATNAAGEDAAYAAYAATNAAARDEDAAYAAYTAAYTAARAATNTSAERDWQNDRLTRLLHGHLSRTADRVAR